MTAEAGQVRDGRAAVLQLAHLRSATQRALGATDLSIDCDVVGRGERITPARAEEPRPKGDSNVSVSAAALEVTEVQSRLQ